MAADRVRFTDPGSPEAAADLLWRVLLAHYAARGRWERRKASANATAAWHIYPQQYLFRCWTNCDDAFSYRHPLTCMVKVNLLQHEPCRSLSNLDIAGQLISVNTVPKFGAAKYYLEVLVFVRKPIQEVASFVGRFRSEPGPFAVSNDYVEALLSSKQYTNARSAAEKSLCVIRSVHC